MRYVVIINLDYENHDHGMLRQLFAEIRERMQEQGFVPDGRRFTIDADRDEAEHLARLAIDDLERQYAATGDSVYACIKEFIGFEVEAAVNLLLPPDDDIEVSELEGLEGLQLIDLLHYK